MYKRVHTYPHAPGEYVQFCRDVSVGLNLLVFLARRAEFLSATGGFFVKRHVCLPSSRVCMHGLAAHSSEKIGAVTPQSHAYRERPVALRVHSQGIVYGQFIPCYQRRVWEREKSEKNYEGPAC